LSVPQPPGSRTTESRPQPIAARSPLRRDGVSPASLSLPLPGKQPGDKRSASGTTGYLKLAVLVKATLSPKIRVQCLMECLIGIFTSLAAGVPRLQAARGHCWRSGSAGDISRAGAELPQDLAQHAENNFRIVGVQVHAPYQATGLLLGGGEVCGGGIAAGGECI